MLFVGWEGVGLCSYLLVGFYFTEEFATNAANKAFIVNRIGDFGFSLANVPDRLPVSALWILATSLTCRSAGRPEAVA